MSTEKKDVTINVYRQEGTDKLFLVTIEDGGGASVTDSSTVWRGKTVEWVAMTESGIEKITAIEAKPSTSNIFKNKGPFPNKNKTVWTGEIKEDANNTEEYTIKYVVDGVELIDDPALDVEPPK